MDVKGKCVKCGIVFDVSKDNLQYQIEHKVVASGDKIFLTYYSCPKCGEVHYVQIDNEETKSQCEQVTREFARLSVRKKTHKKISAKTKGTFAKARKDLAETRMVLMSQYNNALVQKPGGKVTKVRFVDAGL